jgi:phosphoserine aminotransferase
MISFYPGPSRVHDEVPRYVKEAFEEGILSMNHRSDEFMKISEKTIQLLKSKLNIPKEFTVFYTSSATECWEIIAQSLITKTSYHVFNGAFGKKWFEYTKRICSGAKSLPFHREKLPDVNKIPSGKAVEVIAVTQNETSNGTQVSKDIIQSIKDRCPASLVAIDATSSMGGIALDFNTADIWLASVQKCFGLPAGLGLMICSPGAMQKVRKVGDKKYYNSMTFMAEMMEKWQTPFTPNVLNIYLLMRVLERSKSIDQVQARVEKRYQGWIDFFETRETIRHFIKNKDVHSFTVVPVEAKESLIASIKSRAKKNNILLGEGYGELKDTTFRIANFPAIRKKEIKTLKELLSDYH